jgi:cystathionine beta-lyase
MSRDLEALREDGGLKWSQYGPDVLAAWVAEMDFGLAPAITSALHDAVDRGLTGYPYPQAEHETASAATGFWAERFGWEVDPSWVFPAPELVSWRAIDNVCRRTPAVCSRKSKKWSRRSRTRVNSWCA